MRLAATALKWIAVESGIFHGQAGSAAKPSLREDPKESCTLWQTVTGWPTRQGKAACWPDCRFRSFTMDWIRRCFVRWTALLPGRFWAFLRECQWYLLQLMSPMINARAC